MPKIDTTKILKRTDKGTFVPYYGEAMKTIGVRVPSSVAEKIDKIPEKTQFLRDAIIKAVDEYEQR